jgi:toxin ParE1/3/4
MKLVYSRRALSDIDAIATYYSAHASPATAKSIERRLLDVIERIRHNPESAPRVALRSEVRTATVVRYPFRVFYRARGDAIEILHIRHTSRRPLRYGDTELR